MDSTFNFANYCYCNFFLSADPGYAQKHTEPQMEVNKEIGRLFSKKADMTIDAAERLGSRKPEPTRAVPFLLRALKDLESNKMEVAGNKSEVVKALGNSLQNITGQTIGKDFKQWEKYIATNHPEVQS